MTGERYFFVDKFFETDFKKITPGAPMGTRVFDLSKVLETEQLPESIRLMDSIQSRCIHS